MVTHWESSTRPLFVKTVWRDGQHHVVLKNEEESTRRTTNSNPNSARTVKSAKLSSNNKKLSSASVKLLLAGVGTFNAPEQKLTRCKSGGITLEHVPRWSPARENPVTLRNRQQAINISPEFKRNGNLNLAIKSNSMDINVGREYYDRIGTVSPCISYNNYLEPSSNSLSERVMVWLDLATQNGNYTKEVNIQPQRIVTACHISQRRHHTAIKRKSFVNYKLNVNCDRNGNVFRVEGSSQALQSVNSSVSIHSPSADEENKVLGENRACVELEHQLSSEIEEDMMVQGLDLIMPKKNTNSIKRQLHIFMPNLPKKYSDCDSSILSSKISSGSLQRSIYSKKI